jgi:hypothetical protein
MGMFGGLIGELGSKHRVSALLEFLRGKRKAMKRKGPAGTPGLFYFLALAILLWV